MTPLEQNLEMTRKMKTNNYFSSDLMSQAYLAQFWGVFGIGFWSAVAALL